MTRPLSRALFFLFHVILPLVVGGLIYVCWRNQQLLMFTWFSALGADPGIEWLRFQTAALQNLLPPWVVWSLPNGLWVYALTVLMARIWQDSRDRFSACAWTCSGLLLAAASELGQWAGVVPGVFDWQDLVLCLCATALALALVARDPQKGWSEPESC